MRKSVKGEAQAAYLLKLLRASPRPLGAYELLARARRKGIVSPTIIYRALKRLLDAGEIHRVASLNAFVAIRGENISRPSDEGKPHPICFAICDGCGSANELNAPAAYPHLGIDASASAFAPRSITVEVRGLCGQCRQTHRVRRTGVRYI
jgi:Fur family zinc uptake transcriptional regulator